VPSEPVPAPKTLSAMTRMLLTVGTLGGLGAAAWLVFAGVAERGRDVEALRKTAADRAIPTVQAAVPGNQRNTVVVELPGRLDPYVRAELFARVSGYVASWTKDIGAQIKTGDVLAEIDAPDLDQQLAQAQSDLANARVNEQLSKITTERFQALLPNNTVSRQTADEKAADFNAKHALVKSSQANVDRLIALSQYKRIVAPFDGTIIARNTDLGALINVGSGSGNGSPLFVVANADKLRLFISVPQTYAPFVKVGTIAHVTVPERPKQIYDAQVEATSGAVEPSSGTIRMQLVVDNAKGELILGGYANVSLDLTNQRNVLTIPASALIVDKNGLSVAIANADQTVSLKKVTVARDLGKAIEIGSGLNLDDLVIDSPPDGLVDGDHVRLKAKATKLPAPSADLEKKSTKG